jgi:hypothetical protein
MNSKQVAGIDPSEISTSVFISLNGVHLFIVYLCVLLPHPSSPSFFSSLIFFEVKFTLSNKTQIPRVSLDKSTQLGTHLFVEVHHNFEPK